MAYQQSANTIILLQQINAPPETNQLVVFFFTANQHQPIKQNE
jgi:hypothetical protein